MVQSGMDVDLVEQAGSELSARARDLGTLVASMSRTVGTLPAVWEGRDALRFVTEWWPQHRSQLVEAQAGIDTLARSALDNARAQREVSGGPQGSASTPQVASGTGGSSDGAVPTTLLALTEEPTSLFGWSIRDVTQLVPHVGNAYTVLDDVRALTTGQGGGDAAVATVASLLKGIGTGVPAPHAPVAYLSGVLISEAQFIAGQAQQIDWSPQATTDAVDFMVNHPAEALDGAVSALVHEAPNLLAIFR